MSLSEHRYNKPAEAPASSQILVDRSHLFKGILTGDGNEPNVTATILQTRADPVFSLDNNQVTYTPDSAPNMRHIFVSEYYENPQNNQEQRVAPTLELIRNGSVVATSATGYQRHAGGHTDSSNSISYTDETLGAATYWVRSQQGSAQDEVVNRTIASISITAVELVTVNTLAIQQDVLTPTLQPVSDNEGVELVTNFYNDNNNATFQLNIGLLRATPTNWQALLENVPYSVSAGDLTFFNGDFTFEEGQNSDGSFSYLFTGTTPIDNFGSVVISSLAVPNPQGSDSGIISYYYEDSV